MLFLVKLFNPSDEAKYLTKMSADDKWRNGSWTMLVYKVPICFRPKAQIIFVSFRHVFVFLLVGLNNMKII